MNNFQHQHTAHCESGVMSTMLKAQGVDFNEAMVFGLASALTFVYIPLIKVNGMPLISHTACHQNQSLKMWQNI